MRHVVLITLLGIAASGFAGEGGFPFVAPKQAKQEWREKIEAALLQKVDVDFKATPADEVLKFLKEKAKASIVVHPKSVPTQWPAVTHKQSGPLGDAVKAALKPAGLEFSVRDGVIFVFNRPIIEKDMDFIRPEEMPIQKMLEGRPERLNFQPKGEPAGELLKQLTEPANIKMGMDPALQKVPITLDLEDIGLGLAIRWLARFSGGKIEVQAREGLNIVKR